MLLIEYADTDKTWLFLLPDGCLSDIIFMHYCC